MKIKTTIEKFGLFLVIGDEIIKGKKSVILTDKNIRKYQKGGKKYQKYNLKMNT